MANLLKFASSMVDELFESEGLDIDNETLQSIAVGCGLVRYRKPTEAEMNDPNWWGHEYDIDADTEGVGELTPEFKELRKAAKVA